MAIAGMPTEEQLRRYKAEILSDEAIGALYGISAVSVKRLRKRLGIAGLSRSEAAKAQMARLAPDHCQNPSCERVAKNYKKGLCPACYEWKRTRGTDRTPQREWTRQKGEWCKNCKERRAYCQGLCTPCYYFRQKNGRSRPKYRWAQKCVVCGRPREYRKFRRGRCRTCCDFYYANGVDRTPELIEKIAPLGWCDCGRPADHKGVPLRTMSVERGVEREELYDLCKKCYRLENEPLQTKGETKWSR